MKKLTWVIMFFATLAYAQEDEDQIESLPGVQTEAFGDKLVRLAWQNNPEIDMAEHSVEAAEYDVKIASADWLNIVSVQGNLNEFNIDPTRDVNNRTDFYPRYNVGARINLGMFLAIPATMKRNREQVAIAMAQEQDIRQAIQSQVLQLYYNFLMYDKIYALQSDLMLASENSQAINEEKFTGGEISFEEYNAARGAYTQQQIAFYQAEATYRNTRVQLEELIGMSLEEVR